MPARPRRARRVHPVAWWCWAGGLTVAASRTSDPTLLVLVVAVALLVVSRREDPSAGRPLTGFLVLALVAVALRVALTAALGGGGGTTVLLDLPELRLPGSGVALGGPVTAEALAAATCAGLQLAAILVVVGVANALASPRRLLRHLPAALDDVGTTVVVALSFAPALVDDARRVRAGRALRGRSGRGLGELARLAVPVLDGALERSLTLAASMEGRGYGCRSTVTTHAAARGSALALVGLLGVVAGLYGLLDGSPGAWYGLPLVLLGALVAAASLAVGAGADRRTRYRRDPVSLPEALVVTLAAMPAATLLALGDDPALHPATSPLAAPDPPLAAVLAIAAAGAVAVLTPPVPR